MARLGRRTHCTGRGGGPRGTAPKAEGMTPGRGLPSHLCLRPIILLHLGHLQLRLQPSNLLRSRSEPQPCSFPALLHLVVPLRIAHALRDIKGDAGRGGRRCLNKRLGTHSMGTEIQAFRSNRGWSCVCTRWSCVCESERKESTIAPWLHLQRRLWKYVAVAPDRRALPQP